MAAIQLNFAIRTSSKCKSVHLIGSWDNYKTYHPMSKDSSKSGSWKGQFRFPQHVLSPGGRYWYYYILDGYQVSHDPAKDHTVEPTTGRSLNILDIPVGKSRSSRSGYDDFVPDGRGSHQVVSGLSLSPSQIQHPLPSRPYETKLFRSDNFASHDIEALARQYASQRLRDSDESSDSGLSSDGSSNRSPGHSSHRSSGSSSPSSVSSLDSPLTPGSLSGSPDLATMTTFQPDKQASLGFGTLGEGSECICNRWALMGTGDKVRVNCGGAVCGSSASERECDSSSEEDRKARKKSSSRHHHKSSHHKSSSSSKKSSKSRR